MMLMLYMCCSGRGLLARFSNWHCQAFPIGPIRTCRGGLLTSVVTLQERGMCDCGHVHLAQPGHDPRGSGAVLWWVFGMYHQKHVKGRRVAQAPLSQSPQPFVVTAAASHEMRRLCCCLSGFSSHRWSLRIPCMLMQSPNLAGHSSLLHQHRHMQDLGPGS